uniref:Uncharacterized protein n=1 Tax=Ditylenchus dipsaci TaxID=166011 RepID=A0A915E187_9BILA
MKDEIKCAPWNTTKAYIGAMKGKCLLDQSGIADPTGCQQGFRMRRCLRDRKKKRRLRKLPLKEAKEICREYGLREEELNSLTRWQIIHVIRTLSTQAAKARSDFTGAARFARGNIRVNLADMQEKYKVFCQERFELQNKILSNPDELGTDNNSSAGESDSDNDDMANKLERMVNPGAKPKKTIGGLPFSSSAILSEADKRKLEFEMEERERMDLQKMIRGEVVKGASTVSKGAPGCRCSQLALGHAETVTLDGNMKKLKIFRTFKGEDGKEWTRLEVISHPQLIEAYVRIRTTKDNDFIKVFAQSDEGFKEEKRREKRRLQDQLRRVKKAEDRVRQQTSYQSSQNKQKPKKPPVEKKPPPPPKPSLLKMKCSACGELGHMKTNKYCKLYGQKDPVSLAQRTVGDICPSIQEDEPDLHMEELIAIEGTRLKNLKERCACTFLASF